MVCKYFPVIYRSQMNVVVNDVQSVDQGSDLFLFYMTFSLETAGVSSHRLILHPSPSSLIFIIHSFSSQC